jgi:hypothetical protein
MLLHRGRFFFRAITASNSRKRLLSRPQRLHNVRFVEAAQRGSLALSDRVPRSGVRVTLDAGWASAGNHS